MLRTANDSTGPLHDSRLHEHNLTCATGLWRWPLLRTVEYSQHLHVLFMDLVGGDEGKRTEHELTRVLDSSRTPPVRKRFKRVDTANYVQRNSSGGFGSIAGDVVGNSLKVVGCVNGPTDAHQAR